MKTLDLYNVLNSLSPSTTFNMEMSSVTTTKFPHTLREVTQTVQLGFETCPIFQRWTFDSYLKTPDYRTQRGYIFQSPFLARCESDFETIYLRFAPLTVHEECFRDDHGNILPRKGLNKYMTLIQQRQFNLPYPRKTEKPVWFLINLRHILTCNFLDGPLQDWSYENDE